jgi:leucyl/phenylalanyl-tRNA---protein transferase
MAVELPHSQWAWPDLAGAPEGDVVVTGGGDLEPQTLIDAYRHGLFPMPRGVEGREAQQLDWWSPSPRGVLPLASFHASSSLRRSISRFDVTVDQDFDEVVAGCADPSRDGRWITADIADAYGLLHRLGYAHSVEVWQSEALVGGVYGVSVGGLFAGESMFHRVTDASKVALAGLVDLLHDEWAEQRLFDVQWLTTHLSSLGVIEISRSDYLSRLGVALALPAPARFG